MRTLHGHTCKCDCGGVGGGGRLKMLLAARLAVSMKRFGDEEEGAPRASKWTILNQKSKSIHPIPIQHWLRSWDRGNSKLLLFSPRVMTLRVMNLRVVNLRVMNIRVMTRIRVFQFMPRNRVRVKSPQINDSRIPYLSVLVCGSPTPMLSLEGPVPGSISSECRVSRFQQSTFRSPNRGEGSNGVHFGDSQVL